MASLEQIIKDLQSIIDSGGSGGGGGASATARKAAVESQRLLKLAKEITKVDEKSLNNKAKLLQQAQSQFKIGTEQYKKQQALINATQDQIEQTKKYTEITKKVGQSFIGIGKAAFEGSGNISAFTDNLGSTIGFLGKRLDTNIETFRQLSQVGGNFGKSIVDLRLAARDAALPLDDFAKLVASNSGNLAALFGSTSQGAKQIARLGAETRRLGIDRLAPLGFTVDEINETLLLNLDSQRRTGVLSQLTEKQRVNSAINFALELDKLAKLTGAQRQELMNEIEAQKANERFQVSLQGVTEETRQRLQGFAGAVSKAAPGLTEGIQDLIASGGRPITEASIELIQNIPELQGVIRNLVSGTTSSGEALRDFSNLVPGSVEKFAQATITGQVGFTRLQGPLLQFRDRMLDLNSVSNEQNKSASSLVQGLTTFEQATKVLASQFQGIETSLLKSFGPALGTFANMTQAAFGAGGFVAKALAGAPALTASLFLGGLIGKVLFGPAIQVLTTAKGVAMGIRMSKGLSMFGGGKGGAGGMFKGGPGPGGKFGSFARSGVGRVAAPVGIAMNSMGAYSSLTDDDKSNDMAGYGNIAGMLLGGALGAFGGPAGAMLGASLGGMAGGALGGMFDGKEFGGGMDGGKPYLVGENGPEIVSTKSNSVVSANKNLESTFNTKNLESKMQSMVSELNSANKTLTSMVNGVNTLVAVESRALKAVETSARKDMNQVGMV